MAATKYQVLYRYTNPNSNQFITNDVEDDFDSAIELYHDKHKIAVGTEDEVLAANNGKSDLIIQGNNTANGNYNMLFKFTGTKRVNKKIWMPKATGYVIRDKEAVKNLVTRAVDGDFSGQYLLIEGDSIENGVIISKTNPVASVINITSSDAENGVYFKDMDELMDTLIHKTIGQLISSSIEDYSTLGTWSDYYSSSSGVCSINIKLGYDFETKEIRYRTKYERATARNALTDAEYANVTANNGRGFTTITIKPDQVETYEIPAHYEYSADYPYMICDTYERIEQSPWFILSTHASLNSALEKAKAVVKSVGLDNVKVIKVVPTDQFIKIS